MYWSFLFLIGIAASFHATVHQPNPTIKVAVLIFGDAETATQAAEKLSQTLKGNAELDVLDRDQSRAAAKGRGYSGALNMSLQDARELGAAIGCDFYIVGDAQTLRRSPSTGQNYFESYASLFLVSSRSGKLVVWKQPVFIAPSPEAARQLLLDDLSKIDRTSNYLAAIDETIVEERNEREEAIAGKTPVIEEAPDDPNTADSQGLRLPRPYRRLRPAYPPSAARTEVEATVDVLVDLDIEGEVRRVEVVRWAGFGLDQAAIATVKQLHFFPAMRNGNPIPIRVLLRYNFRKAER
jgi:TonB family protein